LRHEISTHKTSIQKAHFLSGALSHQFLQVQTIMFQFRGRVPRASHCRVSCIPQLFFVHSAACHTSLVCYRSYLTQSIYHFFCLPSLLVSVTNVANAFAGNLVLPYLIAVHARTIVARVSIFSITVAIWFNSSKALSSFFPSPVFDYACQSPDPYTVSVCCKNSVLIYFSEGPAFCSIQEH